MIGYIYCIWSIAISTTVAIAIREDWYWIGALLHKSPVHEQKKFCTSKVPDFLRQPLLSLSDIRYPQSRTTRIFPNTFDSNETKRISMSFQRKEIQVISTKKLTFYKTYLNFKTTFQNFKFNQFTFLSGFTTQNGICVWKMFWSRFQWTIHFAQRIWIEWIATSWIIFTIALPAFDGGRC